MAFAVIETGGKQYRVSPGSVVNIEKLEGEEGSTISFAQVLMYQIDAEPVIGAPLAEGVSVTAEILGQIKGEKIRVSTYKPKKRQRRTLGHRQLLTRIKILDIASATPAAAPRRKAAAAKEENEPA